VAAALVAFTAAGCSHVMQSYDLAPNGLTRTEDRWRSMLAAGHADSVTSRISLGKQDAPGDELLRLLYLGTAAHYSGDYVKSGEYLEAAAALSDDRITKSLSRSVLSLISNDGVLAYTPSRSERLLIPYYAALNYIALGRMEDAAVEARRLSALLQTEVDDGRTSDFPDDVRQLRATMRSLTGAIFEATGNRNDALVAYRNAAALGARVDTTALSSSALGVAADSGTVVVLLENGFVAHRVEQNLFVWLGPDEMRAFSTGGANEDRAHTASSIASRVVSQAFPHDRRDWNRRRGDVYVNLPPELQHSRRHVECVVSPRDDDAGSGSTDNNGTGTTGTGAVGTGNSGAPSIADAARRIPSKPARPAADSAAPAPATPAGPATVRAPGRVAPPRRASTDKSSNRNCRGDDDVPYLLKVAWPVYTDAASATGADLFIGGDTTAVRFADLSGSVVNDYSAQAPLIVARTVARGAAKAALTQSAKRKASDRNEGLGKLIGLIGNVGNVMLERADTRSWHLLPAGLAVVRVRTPVGSTGVRASVNGRTVDLGTVTVRPGTIQFLSGRVF
jgi:hypothetical protein